MLRKLAEKQARRAAHPLRDTLPATTWLELGRSFAAAKCCPACYERIMGREAMEEAMKAAENQEPHQRVTSITGKE